MMAKAFKKMGKIQNEVLSKKQDSLESEKDGTVVTHRDMPTYGMERENIPIGIQNNGLINKGDNNG